MRGWRGWLIVALALSLAGLGVAGAATPKPGLDPSYGEGGVAQVRAPFDLPERTRPEGSEEVPGPYYGAQVIAAEDDGSVLAIGSLRACGKLCDNGLYLSRLDPDGKPDRSFAEGGRLRLRLPAEARHFTVAGDHSGRILLGYREGTDVYIRRLTPQGRLDRSFGRNGVVKLNCACGEGFLQVRLLPERGGRVVVDATGPFGRKQIRVRLFRLRADGAPDRSFGDRGRVEFSAPELPSGVALAPGGAILLGGTTCCSLRRVFVERVTAGGRLDRRFDRTAAGSARRLARLGGYPNLATILPLPDGQVVAVGSSEGRQGFYLRLKPDGRLVRSFGRRGLVRLPFLVYSAALGGGGSVFAAGSGNHAYRVLSDGRTDPAFGGDRGVRVPIEGGPARVISAGGGKALVADYGEVECIRQCSPPMPAVARFVE
jgi:uncharacterized delta-60 repeat protein